MRFMPLLGILLIGCKLAPTAPVAEPDPKRSIAIPETATPAGQPITIVIQPTGQGQQIGMPTGYPRPISTPEPLSPELAARYGQQPQTNLAQPIVLPQQSALSPIPAGSAQQIAPITLGYQQQLPPISTIPQTVYPQTSYPYMNPTGQPPIGTLPTAPWPQQQTLTNPFPTVTQPWNPLPPTDPSSNDPFFDQSFPDMPDFVF